MNINIIKNKLNDHIGEKVRIKFNIGRNRTEEYDAIIKELYKCIFVVQINEGENKLTKSFTYSDIITKTIRITFDEKKD